MNLNKTKATYTEVAISYDYCYSKRRHRALVNVCEYRDIHFGPVHRDPTEATIRYQFDLSRSLHGWDRFFEDHLKDLFQLDDSQISIVKERLKDFLKNEIGVKIHIGLCHKRKEMTVSMYCSQLVFKKHSGIWVICCRENHRHQKDSHLLRKLFEFDGSVLTDKHIKIY